MPPRLRRSNGWSQFDDTAIYGGVICRGTGTFAASSSFIPDLKALRPLAKPPISAGTLATANFCSDQRSAPIVVEPAINRQWQKGVTTVTLSTSRDIIA